MILLTGITGNVGGATATSLTQQGMKFRALVRSPEKVKPEIANNNEIVNADLSDAAKTQAALDGVTQLLLVTPNNDQQSALERSVVDLAVAAGVKQIVKISSIEAGPEAVAPVAKLHFETEQHISANVERAVFLRPTFYMQTLFTMAQPVKTANVLPLPLGETAISMIDVRDIGRAAARVLMNPAEFAGAYPITGTSPTSLKDVANTMSKVLDREVKYVDLPDAAYREQLNKVLASQWHVDAICSLFGEIKAGALNHDFPNVADISGAQATTLEQFLADHRQVFTA